MIHLIIEKKICFDKLEMDLYVKRYGRIGCTGFTYYEYFFIAQMVVEIQ
jgi:hypothetical protein